LLARAGIASRREIERMIEEKRIAIDGTPVEKPATLLTSLHGVTVDGKPVQAAAPARLFRYHKPAGLLTAERDPQGRLTIYDRLPQGLPRVIPVGRLDLNTEGLLLLTTDGGLKRQLELPSSGVERVYRARVFGEISQDRLEGLIQGIEIEGVRYGAIDANLERRTGRNAWVEMKLTEGKNREVRRVLEHLGLKVSRLIRTAYGPFALDDLQPGEVDEVRQHDLVLFRKWLSNPSAAKMEPIISSRPRRAERAPSGSAARPGDKRDAPRPRPPARHMPGSARPGTAPAGPRRHSAEREEAARPRGAAGPGAGRGRRAERSAPGKPDRASKKSTGSPQRVLRARIGRPRSDEAGAERPEGGHSGPGRPKGAPSARPGPAGGAGKPAAGKPAAGKPPAGRPRRPRS
jgi:23S rRNA pseudouridine2605 synthase